MRILSLGFPLPGPSIDNFTFFSAPSFFDYDALIVDPRTLSQLVEDIVERDVEHRTYSGERIVNAQTAALGVSLAEILHNRVDETARLLARGGLVVCLAVPDVPMPPVEGFPSGGRYYWLAPSDALTNMRRGAGTEFAQLDKDDPFAAMIVRMKAKLAYQVHFEPSGESHVIASSAGGAAIAVEGRVGGGHLVLIPPPARPPDSHGRYQLSEALQDAIRSFLRLSSGSSGPQWLHEYTLPGLDERRSQLQTAAARLTEAQISINAAGAALDEVELYQRLLWEEGRFGLEGAVRQALSLLRFRVRPDATDAPATIELQGSDGTRHSALLEVAGDEDVIGIEAHYQMRRRIEDAISSGQSTRGVLFINGYRRRAPSERPEQYTPELAAASGHLRYCVATTEQLFYAVRAALERDEAVVQRFRERLLTTDGILHED